MPIWKVFRDGVMIVPAVGRRVHYRMAVDDPCCAADLVGFNSGTDDDNTVINVNLLSYDPEDGTEVFASGINLSGPDGPEFPNWHYSNHSILI